MDTASELRIFSSRAAEANAQWPMPNTQDPIPEPQAASREPQAASRPLIPSPRSAKVDLHPLNTMLYLDHTCSTPAENLVLDEALLHHAEMNDGPEVLRFWESPDPFVVLGLSCKTDDDVHMEACRVDGIPVLRRRSGGGTVLQGPGSLSYAFIMQMSRSPLLKGIRSTNDYVLGRICEALSDRSPGLCVQGISDIAVEGFKVSGNAQRRKKDWILFHGTLLHDFSIESVERYLRRPPRQPEYRENRSHSDFLRTLSLTPEEMKTRIRTAWKAEQPFTAMNQLPFDELSSRYQLL